jgi:hypothetical protein
LENSFAPATVLVSSENVVCQVLSDWSFTQGAEEKAGQEFAGGISQNLVVPTVSQKTLKGAHREFRKKMVHPAKIMYSSRQNQTVAFCQGCLD